MGNEVSLSQSDIHAGPAAVRSRLRSGAASANKRMLFSEDVGPLPKGCKCTPLGFAILSWNVELLDALLASGADHRKPVGLPLRFDFSPLQLAVALGFAAGVRRLLAAGADANAPLQLKRGTTTAPRPTSQPFLQPPHLLADADAADAAGSVQLLLPDCLARARPGDAPLHIAIDCAAVAESGAESSLPASVDGCRMEVFEALLGHAATDLNRPNARGRTPLYKACKRRVDVFVALLATHPGVDVNAGWPLFAAIKAGSPTLVRALLQAGAGPTCTVTNAAGQTPLSYAVRRATGAESEMGGGGGGGRAEVVGLLVQAGSHVDPELVSYAEERGWWGVVAALRSGDPGGSAAAAAAAAPPPMSATSSSSGATGGADDAGGQQPGHGAGVAASGSTPRMLAAAAAWALKRMASRARGGSGGGGGGDGRTAAGEGENTVIRSGSNMGGAGGGHDGSVGVPAAAGRDAAGGRGASNGRRAGSGSASSSPAAARAAAPSCGGGGGGGGWRFSVPVLSRPPQRRPPLLSEQMQTNPILLLFLPVLLPIMLFELIAVAIGEVLQVVVIAALCVLAFLAPAALFGMYRVVRLLASLLYAALDRGAAAAAGGVGGTADGGHRPAAAAAGDGTQAGETVASGSGAPVGIGLQSLGSAPLQLGLLAAPAAVTAPPTADGAASALLTGAGLAAGAAGDGGAGTAVVAAAAAAEVTAAGCGAVPKGLPALLEGVRSGSAFAGGEVSYSGSVTAAAAAVDSVQPLLPGGLDGFQEGLLPLQNQLQLQQGSCAPPPATTATTAAAAAAAALNDFSPGASSTPGQVLVRTAAAATATTADVPSLSAQSFALWLLGLLWRAYLGLILALAATVIALVAVRITYDIAEAAARRVLPSAGSELGAFLHARAQRPRRRGGRGGGDAEFGLVVVIAVGLRWLDDTSFWTLPLLLAAIWAVVEAVWLVEEFRQQRRSGGAARLGGGSPAGPPRRRAAPGGSGDDAALRSTQPPAAQVPPSFTAAGTAAAASGGGAGGEVASGGLDGLCCVCMSGRAVMGFVHRDVVHCCMCEECEAVLRSRGSLAKCLICKGPASAVAKVIAT